MRLESKLSPVKFIKVPLTWLSPVSLHRTSLIINVPCHRKIGGLGTDLTRKGMYYLVKSADNKE